MRTRQFCGRDPDTKNVANIFGLETTDKLVRTLWEARHKDSLSPETLKGSCLPQYIYEALRNTSAIEIEKHTELYTLLFNWGNWLWAKLGKLPLHELMVKWNRELQTMARLSKMRGDLEEALDRAVGPIEAAIVAGSAGAADMAVSLFVWLWLFGTGHIKPYGADLC